MKILEQLLETLDTSAEVRDIRLGLFQTAVLSRRCGLASTLPRDALEQRSRSRPLVADAGDLLERSAAELARMVLSESLLEASVGMATIGSLLDVDLDSCVELNAGDLIAERGRGKRVAVVGHFPFVDRLRGIAAELRVIEKNPLPGDASEREADEILPRADVVGITGTALFNHTLARLLERCDDSAYVVVLGGSTPLTPLLFDHGVDAVSGTVVTDPERVLRCVSQGATFRQIAGKRLLTMMR